LDGAVEHHFVDLVHLVGKGVVGVGNFHCQVEMTSPSKFQVVGLNVVAFSGLEVDGSFGSIDVGCVEIAHILIDDVVSDERSSGGSCGPVLGVDVEMEAVIADASEGVGASDWGSEVSSPNLSIVATIHVGFSHIGSEPSFLRGPQSTGVISSNCGHKLSHSIDRARFTVSGVFEAGS
jgi:hypothetical protein